MNQTKLALLGMVVLAAAAAGCDGEVTTGSGAAGGTAGSGGESTSSSGGGGSGGVATGGGGSGGTTTGGGGSGGTTTTTTTTSTPMPSGDSALAVHLLRIGDQTPSGQPSATAWKSYGFDIDGKVSTPASVDLCQPAAGASKNSAYPDGDNGIDNSFGKNVLPIFLALASDLSTQINAAIDAGDFTLLTEIEGITPGATGTFVGKMYSGGFDGAGVPAWNGADAWSVRSDCLVGGDIDNPKAQFPTSEVLVDGSGTRVWQSVGTAELQIELPVAGVPLTLTIHQARVTAVLADDNTTATSGIIGGVLDTEELVAQLAIVAGSFDPSLCPPSATFESIAQQIRQASDILADGTQDPGVTCNGISIGLGFEAEAATLGVVFDAPVPPDPCNP